MALVADNSIESQAPRGKVRLSKTPDRIKVHQDYVKFSRLMHGGVYYNLHELRELLKSQAFKNFASLFPRANTSGDQGPDPALPGIDDCALSPTSGPTKAS